MPCEMIVAAVDMSIAKGEISTVRDQPWTWGAKEGLPNWVQIVVSDRTAAQVLTYLQNWRAAFDFTIVSQQAGVGARIRVEVAPEAISLSGVGANIIKAEMRDFLVDIGASVVSTNFPTSFVVDVPNADQQAVRAELKSQFDDRFVVPIQNNRYHFLGADVDAAVNAGGRITRTGVQLAALIVDKLNL